MTQQNIKRLAAVFALYGEIKAMEAENNQRLHSGQSMAYNDTAFMNVSDNLKQLSVLSDDNMEEFVRSL